MRALGPVERALWKLDQAAPLNFTTIARVRGPLSDDTLAAALPALQARHPHLRQRIEDGQFVEDAAVQLALRRATGDWVAEAEHELNARMTVPLARFVRAGEHLLVTLHHSVGDGMSGVYLLRDWLRAATGATLEPLVDPGAVEGLLPAKPGFFSHAGLLAREGWAMARRGRLLRLRREREGFAHESRARVTHVALEAPLVDALTARARAEKTTVHGALSGAMLLGLLDDAGRHRAGVMFGSPVNVRAAVSGGEALGFYVSMLSFNGSVRADAALWEVARDVRRGLEAHLERKAELSILRLLPFVWGVVGGDELEPAALAGSLERVMPATCGLTNLGRLAVQTQYGALAIEECHFAANPLALGDFLATATSLHGRLAWNFVWPEPLISEPHARALVDDIARRLRAAI